ncbi:MAG: ABC transporter ATP-binding protein [Rectinemataceae bacterium]|nr:ABC transporter ATP-binding protein [Rectinemataceae bacterium]
MAYLEMKGITKLYPQKKILANEAVDLSVGHREIHAIVGENGAGKSTLMKILYGLEQPDAGRILLDGAEVRIRKPLDANRLGIGMVHQHFKLIPELSVAENVVLGSEPLKLGVFFDAAKALSSVRNVIAEHGFHVEAEARVSRLTVGEMQQVEIIKMLYRNANLLILDEPTSVLTEQEIRKLFATLDLLRSGGKTCIIITHKLDEVMEISDRVTVMRKGSVVAVRNTSEVDKAELARLMVGKDVLFHLERKPMECGHAVLELRDVVLRQRGQERPLLSGVNLSVGSGEIVGVAGVSGNGLGELEDVVTGLRTISGGTILHGGADISRSTAQELRQKGLAYVPADRLKRGACLDSTVKENFIVYRHKDFLKAGMLRKRGIADFAEGLMDRFSIDGGSDVPIGTLSGGNIQKAILAREMSTDPDLAVFSEPTWGLDVASSQFVYEKILEMRSRGAGVLLISSNLDEILGIADRIAVMYRGKVVGILRNEESLTRELIGTYMLGLRDDFAAGGERKDRAP